MKTDIKFDAKTVVGIGVGVALGYFVFNSKNPFVLIALGVGTGYVANQLTFEITRGKSKEQEEKEALSRISDDIRSTLITDDKSNVEGFKFNKKVGYMFPYGEIQEQSPKDYMDVSFE